MTTSGTTAQVPEWAIFNAARKPTYINTTVANSAIVVSVTPQDPSEAAQYGNLTVCYNLYTGGTLARNAAAGFAVHDWCTEHGRYRYRDSGTAGE